jgi:hypothetical protein
MLCCKHRKRYIEIIVKGKSIDILSGKLFEISKQEEAEIEIIEELLPIDALVIFRQIATKESLIFNQQVQKERILPKKKPSKRFSLFKKFKSSSTVDTSSEKNADHEHCSGEEKKNLHVTTQLESISQEHREEIELDQRMLI